VVTMQRAVVPWPQPLTQNQVRRLHHYTEAATKKRMHLQARAAYRAARLTPVTEPVHVTLTFQPADRRRRDTDGLAPTLKVALDALVTEQVLADDNYTHVPAVTLRITPPIPGEPAACWVTIQPDKEDT